MVLYSKTRSLSTTGAIKDHPYKPTHSQLETILTHIDAGFVFNVSSVEFGLEVRRVNVSVLYVQSRNQNISVLILTDTSW